MGLYDRDYTQEDYRHRQGGMPPLRMIFPRPSTVVGRILLINIVVFIPTIMIGALGNFAINWFSVYPAPVEALQIWRIVTYQFLHGNLGHIFINMLILYFFGPMLERIWGGKRFLIFYLACGAAGGIAYPLLAVPGWLSVGHLIGASGAIFGIVAAVAILFPRQKVYVWGIFPIPMMMLAIIFFFVSFMGLKAGQNQGGEIAHLAGGAVGIVYVLLRARIPQVKVKMHKGAWQKKITAQRNLEAEVDRILKKVHDNGIASLTSSEKRILREATKLQQTQNRY